VLPPLLVAQENARADEEMNEIANRAAPVGGSNPRAAGESDTSRATVVAGQVDPARKSGRLRRRSSLVPNQHRAWAAW
jgi:hypothetical protein